MNQQEAFDLVLIKLRAQGVASIAANGGTCQYRSQFGCCAAGHLLPDDLELDSVDNSLTVGELIDNCDLQELADLSVGFLDDLQVAHDCLMPLAPGVDEHERLALFRLKRFGIERSLAAWEGRMDGIASYYGLSYAKPN